MEVKVVEGDLIDQKTEAIVNTWNQNIIPWWLLLPQGVSGAIKKRAGYQPFIDLGKHGPMPLGSAVVTTAGRLPYRGIIHVAGINMLWRATPFSIAASTKNAITCAKGMSISSVAFPIIGAGSGGFSQSKAQQIMLDAMAEIESPIEVTLVRYRGTL